MGFLAISRRLLTLPGKNNWVKNGPSNEMSRYLTPSKVALLCLISIYTEGVVPNTSAVHVLSFLVSCLLPLESAERTSTASEWKQRSLVSISDLERALSGHASSIPGRSIWDLFLKKIWSLKCLDALEIFFVEIAVVLQKTREERIYDRDNGIAPETGSIRLSRSSPLGVFVRRAQLEFTRLQFHDSVKLWRSFVKYRLPTHPAWARKNPPDEQGAIDVNLVEMAEFPSEMLASVVYGNMDDDSEDEMDISTKDVERLLEFQVGELQSMCMTPILCVDYGQLTGFIGLGGRVPDEMRVQLGRILSSGVTVPSLAHYLRLICTHPVFLPRND